MKTLKLLSLTLILMLTSSAWSSDFEKYQYLDPQHLVPDDLLTKAVTEYQAKSDILHRKDVLSVIDYGKNSADPRFFVIDMQTGNVEAMHVAHGRGSDPDFDGRAQKFSNAPNSLMTSLGVFVTGETYNGEHGESLRLDGISPTNSNARERAIVIHGAKYVSEEHRVQGRSFGCPAVSFDNIKKLINEIGGGSLIYAGVSKQD